MTAKKKPCLTGIDEEHAAELGARSDAFRAYTQRKGMPMTYGTGDPPKTPVKKKGKR